MPIAKLDGVEIYYEIHGTGKPLVMIIEYSGNIDSWDAIDREEHPELYD